MARNVHLRVVASVRQASQSLDPIPRTRCHAVQKRRSTESTQLL